MTANLQKRLARILQLITLLEGGACATTRQLGERLAVTRRTVFRDLAMLREAGFPVSLNPDHGGYQLVRGSRLLDPRSVSVEDLALMVAAAKLSFLNGSPEIRAELENACARLLRATPEAAHQELSGLSRACGIRGVESPGSWFTLRTLLLAIRQKRQVRIRYDQRGASRLVETKVAPYFLIAASGGWKLVGRSSLDRSEREFSLKAIQEIELTEDAFQVPRGKRDDDGDHQAAPPVGL
ncbi:helix-turn-helix transcriptional regulator [Lignipirellula cremea]|nr:WYL domain-containing protein [Lignipirellula cremea]